MTTPQYVVFGTNAVGLATFEALRRRGETVRLVNRSGQTLNLPCTEWTAPFPVPQAGALAATHR